MRILMVHAVQDVVAQMRAAGHIDDAKAAKFLRAVMDKSAYYGGTANRWRVDPDKLHAAVLDHLDGGPNEIDNEVAALKAENARLRTNIERALELLESVGEYVMQETGAVQRFKLELARNTIRRALDGGAGGSYCDTVKEENCTILKLSLRESALDGDA